MAMTIQQTIDTFQFKKARVIQKKQAEALPSFNLFGEYQTNGMHAKSCGWVYLWAKVNQHGIFDICYVGMTGKTLMERCDKHAKGFMPSPKDSTKKTKGQKNGEKICTFLKNNLGHEIHVYARKSADTIVLEETVSLCSAEETAMIKKMRALNAHLWNGRA
jgi:hypothetical protein